jgi:hypothetical protein
MRSGADQRNIQDFGVEFEIRRSCDREAEGAPLLREYAGKTCIEGSNPSGSAKSFHALWVCSKSKATATREGPVALLSLGGQFSGCRFWLVLGD